MEHKKYNVVNKSVRKKDSMQLLLGKPVYVDDITPGDALDQIAFHGTADSWAETTQIQALAKQINLPLHLIPNADHSLETGDVLKDLDILKEVMTQTFHFLKMC